MLLAAFAALALSCTPNQAPTRSHIDADGLMNLREVSGLSVSPDGQHAAVQLQFADPSTNSYHSVWCLIPLDGRSSPRTLGDGGDIIMVALPGVERRTGMWETLAPRWSSNGEYLAVLVRRDNQTQIEVCPIDGSGCSSRSRSEGDVIDLVWDESSAGIVYRAGPSRDVIAQARQSEGEAGFRLDERFELFYSLTPIRMEVPEIGLRYLDLAGGIDRQASDDEARQYSNNRPPADRTSIGQSRSMTTAAVAPVARPPVLADHDVRRWERWGSQGVVWARPAHPDRAGERPPLALFAIRDPASTAVACLDELCSGYIQELSVTHDGRVLIIRRTGWARSVTEVGIWTIASGEVRRLTRTNDVLRSCTALAERAICLHESATTPRRVVALDYRRGQISPVFDPNPGIRAANFSPVRKLEWRTPAGDEAYAYLVIPRRRGSERLPLIVVQYRASGFLRGGVGDEYPVQAFAQRGFAVLVLDRPDDWDALATIRDPVERLRREWEGLSERRRAMSALSSGIEQAVNAGVADPRRIGVTGLSDGAESTTFALIHCNCITAAAISGDFNDPMVFSLASETFRQRMRQQGRGDAPEDWRTWRQLSLALNAESITAPILAQVADRELLLMAQSHRALIDAGHPIDLYVFPDEYHVKWQPAHRRAIYERNLDWFSFWLQGVEDDAPWKARQYERWREWRDRLPSAPSR